MYKGNRDSRRERLARAYDKVDEAYEMACALDKPVEIRQRLYARREAIWSAYRRLGIGFHSQA